LLELIQNSTSVLIRIENKLDLTKPQKLNRILTHLFTQTGHLNYSL